MTLPEALSILFLLVGAGWAVILTAQARGWRSRSLAVFLGLASLAHLLPVIAGIDSWRLLPGMGLSGLSTLGISLVALLAVAFLDRLLSRYRLVDRRLGKKEAYLESLFEGSAEAIVLMDEAGWVLQANHAFGTMFGYAPADLPGRLVDELLVPEERREEAIDLRRRIAEGEKVSLETIRRRRDGTSVNVSILGAPVRLTDGTPAAFTIYRDISQQIEVEGAFLRFETALATMQLGVTITDLTGKIVFTNPSDADMHGYQVEELLGSDVRIFAPEGKGAPMSKGQIDEMRRWGRETTNVRRNGEVFPVRMLSDVVRDRQGRPIGIVTTCEDITQRKRTEQALQESEERYALAVRGAKDGLFDWNLVTDEVYYSARWKAMLGYDEAELGTSPAVWLDRVHEEDVARLKVDLESHREGISAHFENEHRIQHKDGHYLWFLARGIAERDLSGRSYRIAGAMTDVTERRDLEEQLAKDALYDHLTGLPNRAFLNNLLERAFMQAERRPDHKFGVLFLDLDRFKVVND
ncbi:MAG: PAS domain S-box protein, partial [Gemmatimonadetes bacterium]|nr:PAS domain S-box protein [Gemmatimonadota bacterium]